ncbi:HAMP domain-containing histidine kinase [Pseudoflavitalea sp. X16]|uniref:sensor histidine kinase n=1 Tax=Paraflavitalea devenefica TaxID=2716334 RepID=UPI001421FB66|nr:HAMP domain-containing sensor histidine kinase [Paraflavitalea devenefica]NII29377.1 HAMP domain-containing histidine kinase [Paraflavitalea devenefica]
MTNSTLTRLPTLLTVLMVWLFQPLYLPAQNNYIIKHYTNENGLPANGIKGIELDQKNGFLWVGTQGGLVRFDGKHFTGFAASKEVLINSRIALIARNREGTVFFGDDNFSVNRINGDRAVFVLTDTFFIPPPFRPSAGGYDMQSPEKVVEKLRSLKPSSFLPPWVVFHDEAGDSSSFSFIHFKQAYHYQAARNRLLDFPGFDMVVKLNAATYFVRSALELSWYNDSLGKLQPVRIHGLPRNNSWEKEKPRLIWMPGMEAPLIINGQDLWKLTGQRDSLHLQPVCRECCPQNGNITCARLWEEQGLFFLGSETNGLYVVRTPFIHPVRADPTIEAGREEYAQVEVTPGTVTTASGLTFTSRGELIRAKSGFRFPRTNIYQDRQGDCWFSVVDTIFHYHHRDGRVTKMLINNWAAKTVFAEMDGHMYVIFDLAIAEITGDRYRVLYQLPGSVNNVKDFLSADAAVEWKPGTLAIATNKLLLFHRNRPAVLDTIPIPGLTTKIRALCKHGDYLLIGTYGQGFYMYKNGVVKKMPLDKNGYLSHAHCFMPDEKGYCWISTNRGLFKASWQALTTAWEKDLPEIYYHYFGKEDGVFNTEFNGGCQPCAIRLSNDWLSFPTMNGVAILDPLRPHSPPPAGQIFIDEVRTDAALHQANDDYLQALPYPARNLRFRLTMPHFGNPENIYFSYKLEPYHEEWETQDIIQNNTIQFGGLQPGSYTLYLRVRNGFEPNQFGTTVIGFRILKPWYQAWWFYVLCALGFIALMGGVIKWRTARIAKRKEELQELVNLQTRDLEQQSKQLESQLSQLQNQQVRLEEDNNIKARLIGIISHDMISPLKFMGYMSKRLREAFPESDASYHTATFIANVAQELESLSVNILNWIKFHHQSVKMKPERFDLHALITASVEIPATLAKEKGLSFQIDVPEHTEMIQYRQAMGVILYNLSMNAMKYTGKGDISIKSENTADGVLLTVRDTGAGMPPELVWKLNNTESFVAGYSIGETSKYQFGYVIIKDLLRLVDAHMKVESALNEGTTVILQFRKITDTSNMMHG